MDTQLNIAFARPGKRQFLYHRIATSILDEIQTGRYSTGDRLPPESDIQDRFKVSRIVVRQAMDLLERQEIVSREPGRGTFVKKTATETSPGSRKSVVGILSGYRMGPQDPYFSPMLHTLTEALTLSQRSTVLYNVYEADSFDVDHIPNFQELAGIIVLMPDYPNKVERVTNKLLSLRIPIVGVNFRSKVIDCIIPDSYYGGMLAGEHLLSLGHRRLWYLNPPDPPLGWIEELEGFRYAIRRKGGNVDLEVVEVQHPDVYNHICEHVRSKAPLPTAIFAGDDQMAAKVITAFLRYEIRVPQDVSVMGYNDINLDEAHLPPLTTIHVPLAEMAHHAVRQLDQKIASGLIKSTSQQMVLTTQLVIRESTGPVSTERESLSESKQTG